MAGTLTIGTLSDGTYSNSATDLVRGACKAWVNFNGTGTVAIRASYNVSSITDLGTGNFTISFLTAIIDANYSVAASCHYWASAETAGNDILQTNMFTTSSFRVRTQVSSTGTYEDLQQNSVAIFR